MGIKRSLLELGAIIGGMLMMVAPVSAILCAGFEAILAKAYIRSHDITVSDSVIDKMYPTWWPAVIGILVFVFGMWLFFLCISRHRVTLPCCPPFEPNVSARLPSLI